MIGWKKKQKIFHPLISFNIKNLHIPIFLRTFATSINDKGKSKILKYSLQHI